MTKDKYDELFRHNHKVIMSYAITHTRRKQYDEQEVLSEAYMHFLRNIHLLTEENFIRFFANWIKMNCYWDNFSMRTEQFVDENFIMPDEKDDHEDKVSTEIEMMMKFALLEQFKVTLTPELQVIFEILICEYDRVSSSRANKYGYFFSSKKLAKRLDISRTAAYDYCIIISHKLNQFIQNK